MSTPSPDTPETTVINQRRFKHILRNRGYTNISKLAHSLQGSLWRAVHKSTKRKVVIKITDKQLHQQGIVIINGVQVSVFENIIQEILILRLLTANNNNSKMIESKDNESDNNDNDNDDDNKQCPNSIVKYIDSFQTYVI